MSKGLLSNDLRGLISTLESEGRVFRVRREVDPCFELAAVTDRVQARENWPVVFENVKGCRFPVVSNVYGNYGLIAEMLGTDASGLTAAWFRLTSESEPATPPLGDPSQEEFPEIDEIDYADLPRIVYCEKDAGPYLTAGIVVAKDPGTGRSNLSYHRMQMAGDGKLRTRLSRAGDLFRIQQIAERADRPLEIAVILGNAPSINIAGAASIAAGASELDLASRLAGKAFAMRRCETVDIEVPAESEFVLEGEILPHVREPEGPFGEWMGYYVPVTDNHVIRVRRITARKNALFHAILPGSKEELTLSGIPNGALIYKAVRAFDSNVLDVVCLPWLQICAIKMKKTYEGQPQKAMLGAMGAETNRMLYCIVVDDDVDIHDMNDVLWAMSARCRVDRDIFQVPNVPSFARDPHQQHWGRICIDATAPIASRGEFERKRIPGVDRINLDDYL
jgi:UbiD family decarboxylase